MTVDGLKSALLRTGIDENRWAVAYSRKDVGSVEDCICVFDDGQAWSVSYVERGKWTEIGRFASFHDAGRFFWWKLTEAESPFDTN